MAQTKAQRRRANQTAAGAGGVAGGVIGANVGAAMNDIGTSRVQTGRARARFQRSTFKIAQSQKEGALRRGVIRNEDIKARGTTTLNDRQHLKNLGDTWKRAHESGKEARQGLRSAHDTIRSGARLKSRGLATVGASALVAGTGLAAIEHAKPPKRKVRKSMEFAKKDDGYKKKNATTTAALGVGGAGAAAGVYGNAAARGEQRYLKVAQRGVRGAKQATAGMKSPADRNRMKGWTATQVADVKNSRKLIGRFTNVKRAGVAMGALGGGAAVANHLKPIDRKRNQ